MVSLVPNFNRALCESVQATLPGVPFATVLTDMADLPPNFWIEPGQRQHIVCGTPHALAQARAAGHQEQHLSLTSGMLLNPSFYAPRLSEAARAEQCRSLGLDPARPTGIVLFGGQGSRQMLRIARELQDQQLILMCGHNAALAQRLKLLSADAPHAVVGFTSDMAMYLQLADYFIGKPGPGSLSEALRMGLPVITASGAGTMPQERYNARWCARDRRRPGAALDASHPPGGRRDGGPAGGVPGPGPATRQPGDLRSAGDPGHAA